MNKDSLLERELVHLVLWNFAHNFVRWARSRKRDRLYIQKMYDEVTNEYLRNYRPE